MRLESIARAENPYSLMQVFGRGHQAGHLQRGNGVRDQVPGDGGAPEDSHQLYQRDSSNSQRDERVRQSDQLCDQSDGSTGEM